MTSRELRLKLKNAIESACDEYECYPRELEDDFLVEVTVGDILAMLEILEHLK